MALDASALCALITKPNAGRDDRGQDHWMRPEPDEHPVEGIQDQKKDAEPDNDGHEWVELFRHDGPLSSFVRRLNISEIPVNSEVGVSPYQYFEWQFRLSARIFQAVTGRRPRRLDCGTMLRKIGIAQPHTLRREPSHG